ncbi:hypothetical protein G7Y29_04905 [Corynebacterium qintianiae]|uniref:Secreted protein n=1 Tax=Corynebacterium qintianiae TaxID=2709392 RepID=A0A7T0KNU8_9CORY|nr:hypothetical protein [Corynebacterium qintianiae]QPK84110.1 hypothetical protein G7Y29_04905 [Corynebacterium qintianiae]
MRKSLTAAATALALVATAVPAVAQSDNAESSVEGFGTDTYQNLSSESEGAQEARETVQSSNWMGKALGSSENDTPVLDAWVSGSSLPNSLNPVDLANREIVASSKLFSGDVVLSAQGSSELTGSYFIWGLIVLAIGQAIELVMRGLRLVQ